MDIPFDYFFNDRTNPRTIESLSRRPWASSLKTYAEVWAKTARRPTRASCNFDCLAVSTAGSNRKERYLDGRLQNGKLRKGDSAALSRLLTILPPGRSG